MYIAIIISVEINTLSYLLSVLSLQLQGIGEVTSYAAGRP